MGYLFLLKRLKWFGLILLLVFVLLFYDHKHFQTSSDKRLHFKQMGENDSNTPSNDVRTSLENRAVIGTNYYRPTPTSIYAANLNTRRITIELVGCARLGNQMFGHASMLGLAVTNRLKPIVPSKSQLLLAAFDLGIGTETVNSAEWVKCEEKMASAYEDSLNAKISNSNASVLLVGYFQSWRYFDHIRETVVNSLRFKRTYIDKATEFIKKAMEKHYPNATRSQQETVIRVGIHVRRGDMASSTSFQKGYSVASAGYIERAMLYMEQRLTNDSLIRPISLLYIVISDDIKWCQNNIKPKTYPIEFGCNDQAVDMAILSSCNHTIVTVGTFGWWAAYLAGGITVYYKDFPRPGSEIASTFLAEDYFHFSWVGLS